MSLFDVPKYAGEWPQIGKVVEISGDTIKVHWFKGSKSTAWTPCAVPIKGQKGRRQPWVEIVPKTCTKFTGFQLTISNYLPKHVKDFVEAYDFS